MKPATLLVLLFLVAATPVVAQVRVVRHGPDRLTGIDAVDVLVTVTGTAPTCQIDRHELQTLAASTLRAHQLPATISEAARSWFYSVVIDVAASEREGTCAAAVTTELVAQVDGIPEADKHTEPGRWGSLLVGYMPLLRETSLVVGAPGSSNARVRAAVAAHTNAIGRAVRDAR